MVSASAANSYCGLNFQNVPFIGTSVTIPKLDICANHLNNLCTGKNLTHPECLEYCRLPSVDCSENIKSYCLNGNTNISGSETMESLYAKYPVLKPGAPNLKANQELCSCFMPENYYKSLNYNTLVTNSSLSSSLGHGIFDFLENQNVYSTDPSCFYNLCENTQSVKTPAFKSGNDLSCEDGLFCLNNADIYNYGTITGSINIDQANSCARSLNISQVHTNSGTKTNISTTNSPKKIKILPTITNSTTTSSLFSQYKVLIIISGVVLLLIILLLILYFK